MPSQIVFYLVAALAGTAFVVQQAVNAGLKGALGSGIWAGLTNFVIGAVAIGLVILALREPMPSFESASRAPWYAWAGGVLGAVYIVGSVFLLPRIGTATLIALVILGQMLTSLTIDHFGMLGVPVHEANWPRLAGAALLIAGVGLLCAF